MSRSSTNDVRSGRDQETGGGRGKDQGVRHARSARRRYAYNAADKSRPQMDVLFWSDNVKNRRDSKGNYLYSGALRIKSSVSLNI